MRKKVEGVIVPIITPVDEHENVAEGEFRRLLRHCADHGIHGVFVCGSNGEPLGLTQKERDRAIGIALDEVGNDVIVLCGVMDSSTKRVIENVKRVEDMGGKYAVLTPVFYARHASPQESVRLFEEVSKNTQAELLLYNIPLYTGTKLAPETVFEIAKVDRVIGYKDTTGSLPDFMQCLEHFRGTDFSLLQGSMALTLPSMLFGADGSIPSMAPMFPELFVRYHEHCVARNLEKAYRCSQLVQMTMDLWKCTKSQTSATKYAISRATGLCGYRSISPTEPIRLEEMKEMDRRIDRMTEIIAGELAAGL